MDALNTIAIIVGFVAIALILFRIVQAIIQVTAARETVPWFRPVWIAAIVCMPILGTILWFAFGEQTRRASFRV
jgi:Ni,Fe-hydrogenase I cytochrome b subunit